MSGRNQEAPPMSSNTPDDASNDPIPLLRNLVRIDSCDPPGNESAVARCVAAYLAAHDIDSALDEFLPGRVNLLARVPGAGHKRPLVFSAHMDTVPIGGEPWTHPPFGAVCRGDRLYGRGASDIKSGLAAMVAALVKIARRRTALGGDLILALSAGESSNCLGARRFVEQGVLSEAGALLVSEPSSLGVVTAEMGVLWLRIVTHGRSGHVSGDGGVNAILRMTGLIDRLQATTLPNPPHPLLPPAGLSIGRISGGCAVNITPDRCEAEVDIRLRPGTDPGAARSLIADVAGGEADVVTMDYKPAVETEASHPFVATCIASCARLLGAAPAVRGVAYYSDATIYTAAHGTPFAIVGPGELGMSGRPDEYVDISKVRRAVSIFTDIARTWLSS
jgi:succinyl-diaminopimelate desuccinylase